MKGQFIFLILLFFIFGCKRYQTIPPNEKESSKNSTYVEQKQIQSDSLKIVQGNNTEVKVEPEKPKEKTLQECYDETFNELKEMMEDKRPLDFKRAVFISENAFYRDSLDYRNYLTELKKFKTICSDFQANYKIDYNYPDSTNIVRNASIFRLIGHKSFLTFDQGLTRYFDYNFDDFLGEKDWSNQFVTKMIETRKGNCHSLPYLYMILAQELDANSYLSFAPNHIYVKTRCKKLGWYNTELTSGEFPTDAWIKASGYITIEAIKSGIYMDTIGEKQMIGLTVFDLAKSYLNQTENYNNDFALNCCDLVLKYHSNNINAIILKAEILLKKYEEFQKTGNIENAKQTYNEMQGLYMQGLKLGYREMPKKMYLDWLLSIKEYKETHINQKINITFKVEPDNENKTK